MTLRLRSILFCGLWLVCASSAFSKGEYQQAKDGKTLVWNRTPRAGETATWNSGRDRDDYATGFGALTWSNASNKVYALYYGNMVHGKFEGAVNVHTNGRTLHAYFVDGGRVTGWARGPAPSNMKVPEELVIQRRKAEAEKPVAKEAQTELAAKATPAASPTDSAKGRTKPQKVRPTEHIATTTTPEATPPMVAEKRAEPAASASPAHAFDEPTPISNTRPEKETAEATQIPTAEPTPANDQAVEQTPQEQRLTPNNEPSLSKPFQSSAPAVESSRAKPGADAS